MTTGTLSKIPFSSLDLEPVLLQGVQAAGFEHCTEIQAQTMPLILAGSDVEGQAQTGSGKTAAFLLGAMNFLLRHPPGDGYEEGQPRALILAPTRELAIQIHKDAELLGRYSGFRFMVVYGGIGYERQRELLGQGVDFLIGTPGRTIDYHRQRVFNLNHVQVAVLDEADRMFDLGFIRDIRYLLRRMPSPTRRLNMLFSATLSRRVTELAYEHMNNPIGVNASVGRVTVDEVDQVLYHVSKEEKIPLLLGLLRGIGGGRILVFVNTKRVAESLNSFLQSNGFMAEVLSGDVPQKKRLRLLDRFTQGDLPILVATDVAARGLHIPNVSHVFNFDLPQDAEDYVHRIGRTARAGARGDAVSFGCDEFIYSLIDIEAFIGKAIPVRSVAIDLLVDPKPPRPMSHRSHHGTDKRGRAAGYRGRRRTATRGAV